MSFVRREMKEWLESSPRVGCPGCKRTWLTLAEISARGPCPVLGLPACPLYNEAFIWAFDNGRKDLIDYAVLYDLEQICGMTKLIIPTHTNK